MPMRKRRPAPMLLGLPSPGLAKISRLSPSDLSAHVEQLATEADRVKKKMERLEAVTPKPVDRLKILEQQLSRLGALEKIARERMAGREPPVPQQTPTRRPFGPGHRGASAGGGGFRGSSGYRGGPPTPPPTPGGYRGASSPPPAPGTQGPGPQPPPRPSPPKPT